jgi:hypothetical protein
MKLATIMPAENVPALVAQGSLSMKTWFLLLILYSMDNGQVISVTTPAGLFNSFQECQSAGAQTADDFAKWFTSRRTSGIGFLCVPRQ